MLFLSSELDKISSRFMVEKGKGYKERPNYN